MTVIVYRDGVMAADRSIWLGGGVVAGEMRKITRMANGALLACAGSQSTSTMFANWLQKSGDRPAVVNENGFRALQVHPDGAVTLWDELLQPTTYEAPFYVCGVQSAFTLGALYANASAEEAVRLTLRYTDMGSSQGAVDVEHLTTPEWALDRS